MNDIELTFRDKVKLYYELAEHFESELKDNKNKERIENIIRKLKVWGKELKIRQKYYEV